METLTQPLPSHKLFIIEHHFPSKLVNFNFNGNPTESEEWKVETKTPYLIRPVTDSLTDYMGRINVTSLS
jgi:hypothetical protein